jgi:hypothetical protein
MFKTSRLVSGAALAASLLMVSGCTTPYPTRYAQGVSSGFGATPGLSTACANAIDTPSQAVEVKNCLIGRAAGWEARATAARRQSRGAGAFAIPAAAVAIALAAEGDPNHAILPLGVASGAAVTYAGAYARPEEAEVSEKAVAAYNCLLSAVAEWQATSNTAAVKAALDQLEADVGVVGRAYSDPALAIFSNPALVEGLRQRLGGAIARTEVSRSAAKGADLARLGQVEGELVGLQARLVTATDSILASREALEVAQATARANYQRVMADAGLPGARLLKQSDEVDRVAIGEIAKRQLSPLAVASSARQSILTVSAAVQSAVATPTASPAPPPPPPPQGLADPCDAPKGNLVTACADRAYWRAQADAAEGQVRVAAMATARIQRDAAVFDAAFKANKSTDPNLGQTCVVAVTEIPILTASPANVTLHGGKATFTISGGLGFYTFDALPEGWSVTMSSSTRTSVKVDVKGPTTNTAEIKQDVTFYDGSGSGSATVEVTAPANTPAI